MRLKSSIYSRTFSLSPKIRRYYKIDQKYRNLVSCPVITQPTQSQDVQVAGLRNGLTQVKAVTVYWLIARRCFRFFLDRAPGWLASSDSYGDQLSQSEAWINCGTGTCKVTEQKNLAKGLSRYLTGHILSRLDTEQWPTLHFVNNVQTAVLNANVRGTTTFARQHSSAETLYFVS